MTSQGWTPGSYLGARNANHSDSFTAASASHIRVTLKDDTLGLGARTPTLGNDKVAAIDAFQGLLGRLNGKSDVQLEQEQRKRDDTRLALYASQKWQAVNFISGGFLVQEKPDDALNSKTKKKHGSPNDDAIVAGKTSSEESRDDSADDISPHIKDEASVSKTEKASKDMKAKNMKEKKKKKKKEKSDKKVKKDKEDKEKKEKKEKKRDKEEQKKEKKDSSRKRRRAGKDVESESSDSSSSDEADNKDSQQITASSQAPRPNWRHAIRGRHIQQKRMALMDERSLGEVSFHVNSLKRRLLCMSAYIGLDFHDQSLICPAITNYIYCIITPAAAI
jgi:Pin2-interacting protein X1